MVDIKLGPRVCDGEISHTVTSDHHSISHTYEHLMISPDASPPRSPSRKGYRRTIISSTCAAINGILIGQG
jgi:hypothetical protein